MKILYVTAGNHVDYQNDCLLIGLKEKFGADIVDVKKQEHNYVTYDPNRVGSLYGRGMSVTRILPDLEVDRTDILNKIKSKFFDFVVYGSIWRCQDYLNDVLMYYEPKKVVVVDGEDETGLNGVLMRGVSYFKRELIFVTPRVYPISFAIPTCKVDFNREKIKDFSYITPQDRRTYIYHNEKDYYNDYREARFGVTTKKAGWDCMRHYEIMTNGCIPYFPDINSCPPPTMTHFPKEICKSVLQDVQSGMTHTEIYDKHIESLYQHFIKNNTTSALADYFIDTITRI